MTAVRSMSRPARVIAGVVGAVTLLFVIAGAATQGPAGALGMAGLAALLIGVGAAIAGRAHWAFISSRRIGGIVAAAGLVALLVGTAVTPPTPSTAATERTQLPRARHPPPRRRTRPGRTQQQRRRRPRRPSRRRRLPRRPFPSWTPTTGVLNDGSADAAIEAAGRTTALAALAAVQVKGRAPRTGYDRDNFGSGWVDTDRNGCDTRNDILARDLTGETFKPGTRNCVVLTGTLADPYSARTITFQRGQGTSDDVQIDHVVALSDAWQKGAQELDGAQRTAFANDPLNLLAVDGPLNMQKGDGDAATWLPPNRSYRCAYVARQVAVKVSYGLWMTQAEKNAIATVLSSCPNEPLPGGVVAQIPERVQTPAPAPAPAPAPRPRPRRLPAGPAPGSGSGTGSGPRPHRRRRPTTRTARRPELQARPPSAWVSPATARISIATVTESAASSAAPSPPDATAPPPGLQGGGAVVGRAGRSVALARPLCPPRCLFWKSAIIFLILAWF